MPRIREYTNQQTISTGSLEGAAADAAQQAYYQGKSIEGGLNALSHGVGQAEDYKADEEVSANAKKASDLDLQLTKDYEDARQNADPNDPNFAQNFIDKHVQPALDAMSEDAPITRKGQEHLQAATATIKENFFKRALSDQINMAGATRVSNALDSADNYTKSSEIDPSLADTNADAIRTIVAPTVPPEHRAEFTSKALAANYKAGGDAVLDRIEQNPNATPQMFDQAKALLTNWNSPYRKYADPAVVASWLDRVAKAQTLHASLQSRLLEQQLPAMLDQIKSGATPEIAQQAKAAIATLSDKNTDDTIVLRSKWNRDLVSAQQFGQDAQSVRELPDAQIDALRSKTQEDYKVAATDEDRLRIKARMDAIDAGQTARNKEFLQDPALYATNHNNVVGAAAAGFEKNATPQTWANYVQKSEAYQRQLFPGRVPQIATQQMRQTIAQSLQGITTDAQGAQKAGAVLSQWAGVTGGKWTQVASELHSAKILNDDQYVAATLYSKPAAVGMADTILSASAMSGEQRYALHGVPELTAVKAAQEQYQDLARSLGNAPNGAQIVTANIKALAHAMQVRGSTDDAEDLAKTIVNDEYTFHNSLRIPNTPVIDSGKIERGTESVLGDIENHKIIVPPSASGLNENDQRLNYVQRLQAGGAWYTNADETGAILYDSEGGRAVMETGKDGKPHPVELKWKDLQDIGGQNLNVGERLYRGLTGGAQ